MSQRHPLALVAGAATLLSAFPLVTVYASITWLIYTVIAVAVVVGTAMLVRTARGPVWVQVLAMMAGLLVYLTVAFPSGGEVFRLIPTPSTFRHFNELLAAAGQQIRDETAPVPDLDGLLLLTTAGVGMVAILVDLTAVGIRRPALAGLPMLVIYSVPVAVLPEGLSVLPFGFAAAGYLWLLLSDSVDRVRRFGRRFTGDGHDVDVWEPSPLASTGRRLGLVGVVLAILLPVAVPGITSGLLDRYGGGGGTGSGSGPGATVDLTALLRDNLNRKQEFEMVRVSTTDPSPYYLRFGVADQVAGDKGFVSRAPTGGTAVDRGLPAFGPPPGVTSQRYHGTVVTNNFDMHLAPVYQQVVSIQGLDGAWLMDAATNQIYSPPAGPSITRKRYEFDFVRVAYTPAILRTAKPIPAQDAGARELSTVPVFVPQVTQLVAALTAGKATEYDKVRAIYDHFSPANGFTYSLQASGDINVTAIVDFLTNKKGFCVQYAAAMAWLVRVAGFPARVAFGFTQGAGASNGVYPLTNYNLHAWTEVSFPGFGWVPFDATPPGSVAGSVQSAWAPDPANAFPTDGQDQPEKPGDPSASTSSEPTPVPSAEPGGTTPGAGATPINAWWGLGAAAAVAVAVLLLLPALRRRSLRRGRRARSGTVIVLDDDGPADDLPMPILDPAGMVAARRDAHAAWTELIDTMVDFDVKVDEAETPRATAERLGSLLPDPSSVRPSSVRHSSVRLLARAEERARYARVPLSANGLDQAVRSARAALARRATRRQRISAFLMPRSVVLRWRAGWIAGVGRVVGAAGRIRDALLMISPRRLLHPR